MPKKLYCVNFATHRNNRLSLDNSIHCFIQQRRNIHETRNQYGAN